MKPKPDPKRLKRATAQLRADHRPRQLQHEPRLSRADERAITDHVHSSERDAKQTARTELANATADIASRVQTLRDAMHSGAIITRGERNLARRIAHDLDVLNGMFKSPTGHGVH